MASVSATIPTSIDFDSSKIPSEELIDLLTNKANSAKRNALGKDKFKRLKRLVDDLEDAEHEYKKLNNQFRKISKMEEKDRDNTQKIKLQSYPFENARLGQSLIEAYEALKNFI